MRSTGLTNRNFLQIISDLIFVGDISAVLLHSGTIKAAALPVSPLWAISSQQYRYQAVKKIWGRKREK